MAFAILDLVQALRHARKSVFCFSNPFCRVYAGRVTRDERNLIGALTAMRRGRASQARAHALIVCEGYDTTAFMGTAFRLACRLPAPAKAKVGA